MVPADRISRKLSHSHHVRPDGVFSRQNLWPIILLCCALFNLNFWWRTPEADGTKDLLHVTSQQSFVILGLQSLKICRNGTHFFDVPTVEIPQVHYPWENRTFLNPRLESQLFINHKHDHSDIFCSYSLFSSARRTSTQDVGVITFVRVLSWSHKPKLSRLMVRSGMNSTETTILFLCRNISVSM